MGNICCGFGHRKIYGEIPGLRAEIEKNVDRGITEFYTGGMGDFDRIFSDTVRGVRNTKLILVIPYITKELNINKEYYESLYDEVIIPKGLDEMYPKSAITMRNRWIVEHSEIVLGYITKKSGGAYTAMKYAEKIGKRVVYL